MVNVTAVPSTVKEAVKPVSGVSVNVWFLPKFTITDPEGLMVPWLPAVAVMVSGMAGNVAARVWAAVTLVSVKVLFVNVTTMPSTVNWAL